MLMEVGSLGATRQTWRNKTIREVLADLVERNPRASEDRLRALFAECVRDDDEYLSAVIDYAFDNTYRARVRQEARQPVSAIGRAEQLEARAQEARQHAERVEYIKERIILLNQEMPNGMRARNCTLDYMYRLGGKFKTVGKPGSRKTVGETYTEDQYRAKLKGVV